MLVSKSEYKIYADYNQFYLKDKSSPHKTEDIWTEEAFNQMLAVSEKLVAVGTARYAEVIVSVEIHDLAPEVETEKYSRVNECSLEITSGTALLEGCTEGDETARVIELEPATYRIRVLYINLKSVKGDFDGNDSYALQIWKDTEYLPIKTIKP